jgi:Tfp pilus assembly protein PilN
MRITLNLMPAAMVERREARRRRRVLVGIPLLIVGAIALPYALLTSQAGSARRTVRETDQLLAPLRPVVLQLTQLQEQTEEFQRREQEIRALLQGTPRRAGLLEGISGVIPQDMWLQSLALGQDRMSVSGSALQRLSVARFIQDLTRIGAANIRVQFLRQERVGAIEVTSFHLTARVRSPNP